MTDYYLNHAVNLSKQLSSYLLGNGTGEYDTMMEQLRIVIVTVNSTRVDAGIAEGLSSWISTAIKHLNKWTGLGMLADLLVLVSLACLWCICKIRFFQKRGAAMIIKAITAIEAGHSPYTLRMQGYSCLLHLKQKGGTVESCMMPRLTGGADSHLPPFQW